MFESYKTFYLWNHTSDPQAMIFTTGISIYQILNELFLTFVGLLANVSLHFYFFISDRWSHYLEQPLQNISVEKSKQLKFLF